MPRMKTRKKARPVDALPIAPGPGRFTRAELLAGVRFTAAQILDAPARPRRRGWADWTDAPLPITLA